MPDAVTLPDIRTRRLFVATLAVDPILVVGGPSGVGRRIGNAPGGHFIGDRLRGTILPGGSDWQTERGDGTLLLDVRLLLRTDDDALIAMTYTGMRYGPAEAMARLARGELVDPSDYYFRTFASFTTSAPAYEWLNRVQAIGVGHRLPEGPIYDMHELL